MTRAVLIIPCPGRPGDTGHTAAKMLARILRFFYDEIFIITKRPFQVVFKNSDIHVMKLQTENAKSSLLSMLKNMWFHLIIAIKLAEIRPAVVFLITGGETCVLPLLIALMLRIPRVMIVSGVPYHAYEDRFKRALVKLLSYIGLSLTDVIVIYNRFMIDFYPALRRFLSKIKVWHYFFLENAFRRLKRFEERRYIGYIGRLARIKNVLNFVKAIPLVLAKHPHARFLIVGDGPLKSYIVSLVNELRLGEKVRLVGWVRREELPFYMNELKLIVIPSISEGLPKVLIEAMACGVVPIVNPVGGIPYLVEDGKTGFHMRGTAPEDIAEIISLALSDENRLREMSLRASSKVWGSYRFEHVLRSYEVTISPSLKMRSPKLPR